MNVQITAVHNDGNVCFPMVMQILCGIIYIIYTHIYITYT